MPYITIDAPAKINLRLKVTGKRPDGYHLLSMLNTKLTLGDKIFIRTTSPIHKTDSNNQTDSFRVALTCPAFPELQTDSNLIVKAARKLSVEYNVSSDLEIHVDKVIPMGAGLGGGSSDAASTLLALNKLWGLYLSPEELAKIGVTIGADVPFFLKQGPAKVTGIGEIMDFNVSIPKLWILLVNPGFGIATKDVYSKLDLKLTQNIENDRFPAFFNDLGHLANFVDNDLERVVEREYSEIGSIEKYLREKGAVVAFMSGSGSTVVGIFADKISRDSALVGEKDPSWRFFPTESAFFGGSHGDHRDKSLPCK